MPNNKVRWLFLMLLAAGTATAQVVSPFEIKDAELRSLQQQYLKDLAQVGRDILANHFDYPFYFSRKLDLDQPQQQRSDQRSIRFDHFNGQTVLAITGNYYAAYSAEKVREEQRAKNSFQNVVLPILKATVPRFQTNGAIQGYAVEISHHVMTKVMGMPVERPENLMVFLPQNAAIKLVEARDTGGQQAALLDAQVYLNAAPLSLWLDEQAPRHVVAHPPMQRIEEKESSLDRAEAQLAHAAMPESPKSEEVPAPGAAPRYASPQALAALQTSSQEMIARMVKELDAQAHFVAYAPPVFITFRRGIYLELSVNTTLMESSGGSRYKLAGLAFDEHITHLIRPFMGYFKGGQDFDGIAFSTTVHLPGKTNAESAVTEAVEFFFPFRALHCYEDYDCTGQQLIDDGIVLINGERAGLDLQKAEADGP